MPKLPATHWLFFAPRKPERGLLTKHSRMQKTPHH